MEGTARLTPIEAWFATAGLEVVEVGACPVPECPVCRPALDDAA